VRRHVRGNDKHAGQIERVAGRRRGGEMAAVNRVERAAENADTRQHSSESLCPSDSPTRALAGRFAGSLRSRGSRTAFARTVFNQAILRDSYC
jgi:hypothetical protein